MMHNPVPYTLEWYVWRHLPYVSSHRAVLCMIVASFEYSVITMVNDVKFTAATWRMAYV